MNHSFLDPLGLKRVVRPLGLLPQQAEEVSAALPIGRDELLIEVEALNIDSASFKQIKDVCAVSLGGSNADPAELAAAMERHILELVKKRGKHHNPVTGSGGMLIGRVTEVGADFPVKTKPVKVGDRIATLVSLSLTPLHIRKIKKIHLGTDRVEIEGHAILFATGLFAKLPKDFSDTVTLAILDVAGAPAQTELLVKENDTVLVVGGGGKSGVLCLAQAKKVKGVTTIALDYSDQSVHRAKSLGYADHVLQMDARQAVNVFEAVQKVTGGKMADLVINVANVPETEMACILAARDQGIVYFFSMATNFQRAALGAEGVGADVDLRIGNGYTRGHADQALNLVRSDSKLKTFFEQTYGAE